ncbi:HEAT repeat domain-containing protein [Maritalea porphyrae]|uniref:HEAT repeat domain-containing protein n=1 Tax=Maritalea porphyrae TaxID=880732 RepID=UPI0022AE57B9|nr:HEAT repeat domain-containing protein [Maritalea porphyrae]MCZ4272998.1 HEAT repeat domain-containing protein [Maritalea porphyrae]
MIERTDKANLAAALQADDASVRLKAAMAAGLKPEISLLDLLVERCSLEPDFGVREQLTWSLIRFPKELIVPKLISEVSSSSNQARSQALHSLSKIEGADAWNVITKDLLEDSCDEVAQAAWRAAVTLVPPGKKGGLAKDLGALLGRGGRELQRSLSISLAALGESAVRPVLKKALASSDKAVRNHALFTKEVLADSDAGSEFAVDQVKILLAPRPKD